VRSRGEWKGEGAVRLERYYEGMDDETDVWRTPDGTWHAKLGARIRVVLVPPRGGVCRSYHVRDHLPAGLEAEAGDEILDDGAWLRGSPTVYVVRAYRAGEFLVPPAFTMLSGAEEVNGFSAPGRMVVHAHGDRIAH
jgi:hypothetical protein